MKQEFNTSPPGHPGDVCIRIALPQRAQEIGCSQYIAGRAEFYDEDTRVDGVIPWAGLTKGVVIFMGLARPVEAIETAIGVQGSQDYFPFFRSINRCTLSA
jgi:hypothetical protein